MGPQSQSEPAGLPLHSFVLRFAVPQGMNLEDAAELLYRSGCDDAAIGIGRAERIALDFSRHAPTRQEAVARATADVLRAIPQARLLPVGSH